MKNPIAAIALALVCTMSLASCSFLQSDSQSQTPSVPDPDTPPASSQGTTLAENSGSKPDSDTKPGDVEPMPSPDDVAPQITVPFTGDQMYAAAYLGWQDKSGLEDYVGKYIASADLPIHYISDGDFYLVIPRYEDGRIEIYRNDVETSEGALIYEAPSSGPFLIQCNASDIFTDVTIRFIRGGETADFSPFISLENGDVVVGDQGLNLTLPTDETPAT